jgi:hypothetical protein
MQVTKQSTLSWSESLWSTYGSTIEWLKNLENPERFPWADASFSIEEESWGMLPLLADVFQRLAQHRSPPIQPEQVCQILDELGYAALSPSTL